MPCVGQIFSLPLQHARCFLEISQVRDNIDHEVWCKTGVSFAVKALSQILPNNLQRKTIKLGQIKTKKPHAVFL